MKQLMIQCNHNAQAYKHYMCQIKEVINYYVSAKESDREKDNHAYI